jgi:hypothetical protein
MENTLLVIDSTQNKHDTSTNSIVSVVKINDSIIEYDYANPRKLFNAVESAFTKLLEGDFVFSAEELGFDPTFETYDCEDLSDLRLSKSEVKMTSLINLLANLALDGQGIRTFYVEEGDNLLKWK